MFTQFHFTRVTGLFVIFFFIGLKLPAQNATTEILWDNYGVPHIYANTNKEMYYAFGWAQMNNHANLLLELYGQSRGRAAEYWGSEWLESDKQIWIFDLPSKGKEIYGKQTKEFKAYAEAFVKGINDFAKAHPAAIEENMKQVLPVLPADVFTSALRTNFRFLTASERTETEKLIQAGSNAYAIGPSRSSSKNAMLVINPHLRWKKDFTMFMEAHLHSNEFNAYGATLVGQPILTTAFNDNLGWTHTVNTIDAADRYELTLQNDGYLLDGQIIQFDKKAIYIKVKQSDGSLKDEKLEIRNSKHGPVLGDKKQQGVRCQGCGVGQ